ncbi:MAG TPA: rRNA maturation RNase YbeY [Dokdonella sp.]|uniref:rRNA maturation RNase YbeY n=1 Tax=Dokdonella sp. TaxID=2291710 RepID=UPI002B71E9B7|nr:rRNA maturation RNase YbeY [Dokdonella sp.]HOX70169.1 rRNA maturation RNase YbeY [Dokdonella sp.]HPG95511.1 rRNA maturation RNase YbeY [Dokdonella sp.]HPN78280.1 rRNA maturation RNase YbeY [Dokdonella sp.]
MRLELQLSRSVGLGPRGIPQRSSFVRWVEAALRGAKRRRDCEIAIRIVDSREGRHLNMTYRKRDYATNVLSFPADLPEGVSLPLIGDLVICAPVVAREAKEQRKVLRDHYAHMTIHGTLHLLGHDHENDADAERMEALERDILAGFSVADPYAS